MKSKLMNYKRFRLRTLRRLQLDNALNKFTPLSENTIFELFCKRVMIIEQELINIYLL